MRPNTVMSLSLATPNTPTTNTLTPTTFKKITQLFESEECLESIQGFDGGNNADDGNCHGGGFVPPSVTPASILMNVSSTEENRTKRTFISLESSKLTWQGGLTQIMTPSKTEQPFIVIASEENEENEMGLLSQAMIPTQVEAMKVRPRKSTRLARSNTAEFVKDLLDANEGAQDPDYEDEEEEEEVQQSKKKNGGTGRKRSSNGGRKSAANQEKMDEDLDPEDFGRLMVRRQRNKEAAARCRKRRVDLTDDLQGQVDQAASKRRALEDEIKALKAQKEDLEFILQAHSHSCKISGTFRMPAPTLAVPLHLQQQQQQQHLAVAVKSEPVIVEPVNAPYLLPEQVMLPQVDEDYSKPKRPASLFLAASGKDRRSPVEIKTGITIETPTAFLMHSLGFDSVTTGLTPSCPSIPSLVTSIVTPTLNTPTTCSSQQRASELLGLDVSTPDFVIL